MAGRERRRPGTATWRTGLVRIILLHLLPGVPLSVVAVAGAPVAAALGLPAVAAAFAAVLLVLVPVELGLLAHLLRAEGRSLGALVRRLRRPTTRELLVVVAPVLAVQAAVYALVWGPVEDATRRIAFGWLPEVFGRADGQDPAAFGPGALAFTWCLGLLANGVLGPVVEELWFRGYLLPRLSHLGRLAPVLNAFLFSAYHLFAPWQLVSRFLFALPFVHAVWRTRRIEIGITVHVVNNVVSMLLLLGGYLAVF